MLHGQALRHPDRCILLTLFERTGGRIAVDVLMHMQETRMARLRHASMGVDKWRQCQQGDDEPEHYEAVKLIRHGRIGGGSGKWQKTDLFRF